MAYLWTLSSDARVLQKLEEILREVSQPNIAKTRRLLVVRSVRPSLGRWPSTMVCGVAWRGVAWCGSWCGSWRGVTWRGVPVPYCIAQTRILRLQPDAESGERVGKAAQAPDRHQTRLVQRERADAERNRVARNRAL